jgi:predicted transport protein
MGEAIARNLPAKTGRTFQQWVDLVKKAGLATRPERVQWLKSKHQLGAVTANFIAAEAEGRSIIDAYADESALLETMYSGEKAALRPIYEELARAARELGKDVDLTVCKTYVGIRKGRQFAMIKPATRTRVDLGLVLPEAKPAGRLLNAGSIGNERMTHRIEIASKKEIDAELRRWLRAAYERAE